MPVQPNKQYMPNHLSLLERLAILGRIFGATDRINIPASGGIQRWYAQIPSSEVKDVTFLRYRLMSFNGGGIIYRLWVNPTSYDEDPADLLIPASPDSVVEYGRATNVVLGDAVLAQYDEIPLTAGFANNPVGENFPSVLNFQPSTPSVSVIIEAENQSSTAVDFTISFQWAEGTIITTPN